MAGVAISIVAERLGCTEGKGRSSAKVDALSAAPVSSAKAIHRLPVCARLVGPLAVHAALMPPVWTSRPRLRSPFEHLPTKC
jgi:hypothetical protein